jgi:hypothetical protein
MAGFQVKIETAIFLAGVGGASVEEDDGGVAGVGIIDSKLNPIEEGLGVWLTDLWGQELGGPSVGAWGVCV